LKLQLQNHERKKKKNEKLCKISLHTFGNNSYNICSFIEWNVRRKLTAGTIEYRYQDTIYFIQFYVENRLYSS